MLHEFTSNFYAEILYNHLENIPALKSVSIQYSNASGPTRVQTYGNGFLTLKHGGNHDSIVAEYTVNDEIITVGLHEFFKFSSSRWASESRLYSTELITNEFIDDALRRQMNYGDIDNYELLPAISTTVRSIAFVLRLFAQDVVKRAFQPISTDPDTLAVYAFEVGRSTNTMEESVLTIFRHNREINVSTSNSNFTSSFFDRIVRVITKHDDLTNGQNFYDTLQRQNCLLPIDMLFDNIYIDTDLISKPSPTSPMDVTAWSIAPLSRVEFEQNGFISRAYKSVYIDLSVAKELFGDLEQCPITLRYYYPKAVSGRHSNMYGMYRWSQYFDNAPSGDEPNISYEAMHLIGKEIIYAECEDCGTRDHVSESQFVSRVVEGYGHIFGSHDDCPNIYNHLYRFARMNYDDDEPNYYCGSCERGTDEDDYYEDEDYRDESLSSSERDRLSSIATDYGKDLVNPRGNLYYFADDAATYTYKYSDVEDYLIGSWDHQPSDLRFIEGDDMEKTKLYMGLEWEIDGGGTTHAKSNIICSALANNRPYAYTMTDGSLENGIEIATMPATLDAHTNTFNWPLACATATALGYRGHDINTAGIHIHINRNFFSDDKKLQLYRGSLMALVMERNWEDFARFSRRRYNRLDQWAKKKDLLKKVQANPNTNDIGGQFNEEYGREKYVALNMGHSNTFEFRIFRSTTKPETILATLQFVSNLAHWAKHNGLAKAQTATMDDIINYKKYPELTAYWEERKDKEVRE
jgi:hypothetical protein